MIKDSTNLVAIVEDDDAVRHSIKRILVGAGIQSIEYASALEFFKDFGTKKSSCVIMDIRMPGMNGIDAYKKMVDLGFTVPVVFITGHATVRLAVDAIKMGAVEFLEKPFNNEMLLNAVTSALQFQHLGRKKEEQKRELMSRYDSLTQREKTVFLHLAQGERVKEVADKLDLSTRTVELYRARIGQKLQATSVPQLTIIAIELQLIK